MWTGPDPSELITGLEPRQEKGLDAAINCRPSLWPGHLSGHWRRFRTYNAGMRILIQCWGTKYCYNWPSLMRLIIISFAPDTKMMVAGWRGINTRVHTWRRVGGNESHCVIRLCLNQHYASNYFQVPVVVTAKLLHQIWKSKLRKSSSAAS